MTKERELLMRICRFLDSNVEDDFGFVSDIRYLLSQPSEEKLTMRQRLEEYKKGYAKAEQHLKREPLSDDEIFNIGYNAGFALDHVENDDDDCSAYGFLNEYGYIDNNPYFKFVRAIEKAHGVGVENE
jgi:hypothetical protein